ncbi:LysM peptidoglycan-binding domain-containing protein [Frigoribacterium sp. CFBP 8754]|uniref:lytic transglycosylase n=1 Tax=unclassified Frigoribacterium TaxID=2627005 RepID=UPI0009ECA429|nr:MULTISPECIES: LysM peptidoglycan-binding domain-containing protein [unclassified Frigoribacterium]MBD8659684.1 LysM peptidoglycan-binding domain-containing protein [Frigoribacterium sp. CFBP 8754]
MNDNAPTGTTAAATTTAGTAFARPALVPDDGRAMSRVARSMLNTVPIVLAGSMALGLTGPVASVDHAPRPVKEPHATPRPTLPTTPPVAEAAQEAVVQTAAATAPSSYTVKSGDTVASIAGSFGLSTASVLALNGLSWKSTIFPGQTLSLVAGAVAAPSVPVSSTRASSSPTRYTIARGDTLSSIAGAHGVSTSALLQANGLSWSSIIYPGQQLALPGAAAPARSTPAPTTSTPPAASTGSSSYIIRSGDTVASIAARTGVSTKALLAANGLSFTSTIYAGTTLTIPSTSSTASGTTSAPATTVVATSATPLTVGTALTAEQQGNARTIIRVGRELGVGDRAIVVALAAAAQESSLRNIDWGDRDSVGLYQQRPSTGWGTVAQLTDPVHATKLFFGGRTNPNVGKTRGLLDVKGWSGMSLTAAAQAVQLSAHPTAYAKWEGPAASWLATLG